MNRPESGLEQRMVDTDQVDTFAAYLTPEGYEKARKDEDDNAIV